MFLRKGTWVRTVIEAKTFRMVCSRSGHLLTIDQRKDGQDQQVQLGQMQHHEQLVAQVVVEEVDSRQIEYLAEKEHLSLNSKELTRKSRLPTEWSRTLRTNVGTVAQKRHAEFVVSLHTLVKAGLVWLLYTWFSWCLKV